MSQWLRRIYLEIRHNSIITFVLITLAAWLLEQLANLATGQGTVQFWSQSNLLRLAVLVLATLLAVLLVRGGIALWRRLRQVDQVVGIAPPQRRGLILLFGREATARKAIEHHRNQLEFIWFILTEQTKAEFDQLPANWWGRAVAIPELLLHPYRPEEIGQRIANTVEHAEALKLAPSDLICDVTGGTTAMTIGAFAACVRHDVQVQMVPALYDQARNALQPLPPILIEAKTRRTPRRKPKPV